MYKRERWLASDKGETEVKGEEGCESANIGDANFTAFNMQEELEEGHFDTDGYFIWKNDMGVRDNWLENIDWEKVKSISKTITVLEEDDDSYVEQFQEIQIYKQIITYLDPNETISQALRRWGTRNRNLSSIERLTLKKTRTLDPNTEVTKLTELANKILNETGNMDIYQETYEMINRKIEASESKQLKSAKEPCLDMYADDFDKKEAENLKKNSNMEI
ncbi:CD2 antigen cytoplasmic tail-binding protein 2 homolog [Photinus pyralis]|uniref:CD2 antigen cytoplasmic tail-binding protein 2 homolog n=1 Tax=Photinus pyralis TaxID=7054 RepID=UPI001266F46A|nr:CD2 antigen cytoplasmic tail-binding protein 2 homolog [Photinus pyralis]